MLKCFQKMLPISETCILEVIEWNITFHGGEPWSGQIGLALQISAPLWRSCARSSSHVTITRFTTDPWLFQNNTLFWFYLLIQCARKPIIYVQQLAGWIFAKHTCICTTSSLSNNASFLYLCSTAYVNRSMGQLQARPAANQNSPESPLE